MNRYKIENFLNGSNSTEALNVIDTLVKDNLNICITGQLNVGKTTLTRSLLGLINNENNIMIPDSDSYRELSSHYPERNIIVKKFEEINNKYLDDIRPGRETTTVVVDELNSKESLQYYFRQSSIASTNTIMTHHARSTMTLIESLSYSLIEHGFFTDINHARSTVKSIIDVDINLVRSNEGIINLNRISVISRVSNDLSDLSIKDILVYDAENNNYKISLNTAIK